MSEVLEQRILIHTTVRRDAELAASALGHAGFQVLVRNTLPDVMRALGEGAAALLTVEEALAARATAPLIDYLDRQQTWSDLPIVVLTRPGGDSPWAHDAGERLGNLTLLERPIHAGTLISAMRAAVRARMRQYQIRLAEQRKDEFLAMLAHELRNPLAPIGAAAQLLQLAASDPRKVERTSAIISRQVAHMSSLIDDLLDIARVTRNLIKLVKAPADFRDILAEAVEQVGPLLRERQHALQLHLPPGPAMVCGDHKRMVQIAVNVLNNAVKYTPNGGNIAVRMRMSGGEVCVDIADDGIGMASELVLRVFELFSQAERNSDRSQGGLGLGLPLVKNLVELHDGSVQAHSDGPGKGSRFTLRLPLLSSAGPAAATPVGAAEAHAGEVQPLRVLVVDDNADAADTLAMLLNTSGHHTFSEYTAARAIERSREVHPQVCLLDIGLPDMDGRELARRLRRLPEMARTVLVAVTGYGQAQDRKQSMDAGFDYHLVKPIDTEKLMALLGQVRP